MPLGGSQILRVPATMPVVWQKSLIDSEVCHRFSQVLERAVIRWQS